MQVLTYIAAPKMLRKTNGLPTLNLQKVREGWISRRKNQKMAPPKKSNPKKPDFFFDRSIAMFGKKKLKRKKKCRAFFLALQL